MSMAESECQSPSSQDGTTSSDTSGIEIDEISDSFSSCASDSIPRIAVSPDSYLGKSLPYLGPSPEFGGKLAKRPTNLFRTESFHTTNTSPGADFGSLKRLAEKPVIAPKPKNLLRTTSFGGRNSRSVGNLNKSLGCLESIPAVEIVQLPEKFKKFCQKKLATESGSSNSDAEHSDDVQNVSAHDAIDDNKTAYRSIENPSENGHEEKKNSAQDQVKNEKDLDTAIRWLKQEIFTLKHQDRVLMRSLLDLRAKIHHFHGLSHCYSSLDLGHSGDLDSPDGGCLSVPTEMTAKDLMLSFQNRAVSMVSVTPSYHHSPEEGPEKFV